MEKLQVKKWLWVFFDGKATLVIGTHTHVPTNDSRILDGGTAYQTDAGMCGDYNSVIGMKKEISLKDFLNSSDKNSPALGEATICGAVIDANPDTGLAIKIESFIFGGSFKDK